MTLKEVGVGKSAAIVEVGGEGALRQHFLDMGVLPGAEVTVVKLAPMGDPMELEIHGYELTLRLDDAAKIKVEPIAQRRRNYDQKTFTQKHQHPGLGEAGIFHSRKSETPLPEGTTLTYALVGNQNSGKSDAAGNNGCDNRLHRTHLPTGRMSTWILLLPSMR